MVDRATARHQVPMDPWGSATAVMARSILLLGRRRLPGPSPTVPPAAGGCRDGTTGRKPAGFVSWCGVFRCGRDLGSIKATTERLRSASTISIGQRLARREPVLWGTLLIERAVPSETSVRVAVGQGSPWAIAPSMLSRR